MSDNRRPRVLPGTIEGAAAAVAALRAGAVVAIPTDTVYGLAAALDQPAAIDRLYAIKHRSRAKPIPVLIATLADVELVSARLPPLARALAARFWPGALTIVVPARPGLHPALTAVDPEQRPTIAIRVPDHQLAREVIARAGGALAVTSANRSGDEPALTAAEVAASEAAPDVILDGGRAPGGIASTVLVATGEYPAIAREGAISSATIVAALSEIDPRAAPSEARTGHGV